MTTENKNASGKPAGVITSPPATLLDAGQVAPSMKRYRVTLPHDHKTLREGDVVVMTESPTYDNLLLREPDMTLHRLQDENGQYVHIVEASNVQSSGTRDQPA